MHSSLGGISVHPHMRGDNVFLPTEYDCLGGSPPHAWGQSCVRRAFSRIVPVHPHMRGDNATVIPTPIKVNGSPPHAWGQSRRFRVQVEEYRFTPTCVGTMPVVELLGMSDAVHPHMRGDNYGSTISGYSDDRFTPTCVGTILPQREARRSIPVHPHMRGDNPTASQFMPFFSGSPPHAWGQSLTSVIYAVP